jgi:uncharacterized membrane protein
MEPADIAASVGTGVDIAGVTVIVCGVVLASGAFARRLFRRRDEFAIAYQTYRQGLGRAILLGLEFLVAGDIIRTVAVTPTFHSVGVLAIIVAIRTVLSFSLQMEVEGRPTGRRRVAIAPRPQQP